jgi:hypothetical protein
VFSDAFSEGQTRDINLGFPSDSHPYTEYYDYLSDSDLEDGSSCSDEEDEEPREDDDDSSQKKPEGAPDPQTSQTIVSDGPPPHPSSTETSEAQNNDRSTSFPVDRFRILVNPSHRLNDDLQRTGKVAIIRDMGAVTCVQHSPSPTDSHILLAGRSFEAMLYFLYTGEIKFAPFSSGHRHELPAQARTGDWSTGKLPSPSAKSIYRLADKVIGLTCVWCFLAHQF